MSPPAVDSTKDVEKKSVQRRINKPLIEKRRRARINDSLSQLKSIVLEANDTKNPRPSKLEKADILEMTVEFVKKILHQPDERTTGPNLTQNEYRAGYSECLAEISRFLETTSVANNDLKKDIVDHVTSRLPDTSQKTETTSQKVKSESIKVIPVTPHSTVSNENEAEAIDLSMSSKKQCVMKVEQETQPIFPKPTNLSNSNQNSISNNNNQPSVINQNLPVGVLCGNQVMVLLQLPPVLTSGPCLTQGTVFGSPIKTSQPAFSILQQDQTMILRNSDMCAVTEQSAQEQLSFNVLPQVAHAQNSDHLKSTNQNSCTIMNRNDEPDVHNNDRMNCEETIGEKVCESGPTPADHWRPW